MNKIIFMVLLVCVPAFSQLITLQSPNGGEVFNADSVVEVKIYIDTHSVQFYSIDLSLNGGETWTTWGVGESDSCIVVLKCRVPVLGKTITNARARVCKILSLDTSMRLPNPQDTSDAPFTISPFSNDIYEPNNSFDSAYCLLSGDTLLKSIKVLGGEFGDEDFFKIHLLSGTCLNILTGIAFNTNIYLYDSLKEEIKHQSANSLEFIWGGDYGPQKLSPKPFVFSAKETGIYYIAFFSNRASGIDFFDVSIKIQNNLKLLSPQGSEKFTGGEEIKVSWEASSSFKQSNVELSLDKGKRWHEVGTLKGTGSGTYSFKKKLNRTTSDALIRINGLIGQDSLSDTSDSKFTIEEAPDAYEPNNSFETAYLISSADTLERVAFVAGGDPATSDSLFMDDDYYKINFSVDNLVLAKPMVSSGGTYYSVLSLYDSSRTTLINNLPMLVHGFRTSYSGSYYFRVSAGSQKYSDVFNYNLTVDTFTILAAQKLTIGGKTIDEVVSNDGLTYKAHLVSDSTNLELAFDCGKNDTGAITVMSLSQGSVITPAGTESMLKLVHMEKNIGYSRGLTVTIPYTLSNLNGSPESVLKVLNWNPYEDRKKWELVPSTIDTIQHKIIAQISYIDPGDLFGLFISDASKIHSNQLVRSTSTEFLYQNKCIMVNIQSPKSNKIILRLYDIKGRCIQKSVWPVTGRQTTTVKWDIGVLSKGLYFVDMIAGEYHTREAITIVR